MANPQNIVVGDENFGTDLPQAQVDNDTLGEEKKMAKYSKSAEFARIREHCEARIAYFQQFLPDGRPIASDEISSNDWIIANVIIKEFNALLGSYEIAKEAVDANAPV